MTFLRRPYPLVLAAIIAIALTAGLTAPTPAAAPRQEVHGEVVVPSGPRMVGPIWAGACDFVAAHTMWATQTSPTLVRIPVPANTRGRPFELVPDSPADLDITFQSRGKDTYFESRSPLGEGGTVPADASGALVCLVAGAKTGFTYTAY